MRMINFSWIEAVLGSSLEDVGQQKVTLLVNNHDLDFYPSTGKWYLHAPGIGGASIENLCKYLYAYKKSNEGEPSFSDLPE